MVATGVELTMVCEIVHQLDFRIDDDGRAISMSASRFDVGLPVEQRVHLLQHRDRGRIVDHREILRIDRGEHLAGQGGFEGVGVGGGLLRLLRGIADQLEELRGGSRGRLAAP